MTYIRLSDYTAAELWWLHIAAKQLGQKELADKLLADYYFACDMDLEKSN